MLFFFVGGYIPPVKLTVRPWKWMVGKWHFLLEGLFSEDMLYSFRELTYLVGDWIALLKHITVVKLDHPQWGENNIGQHQSSLSYSMKSLVTLLGSWIHGFHNAINTHMDEWVVLFIPLNLTATTVSCHKLIVLNEHVCSDTKRDYIRGYRWVLFQSISSPIYPNQPRKTNHDCTTWSSRKPPRAQVTSIARHRLLLASVALQIDGPTLKMPTKCW